jgi:F-box interacting protein
MYTVGMAAASGEYKALTIRSTGWPEDQVCMVLTLGGESHGWRERGSPPARIVLRLGEVAVVRGVAYFLTDLRGGWNDWLVAFDLEAEAWRPASIPGPMEPHDEPVYQSFVSLVELNGHLVASIKRYTCDTCAVEVWFLMDPHKPLWSKQYTITLPTTGDVREYFGKPLQVLEDGRIVVWIWKFCTKYRGVLRVYGTRTETFTDGAGAAGCRAVGGVYTGSMLRNVYALSYVTNLTGPKLLSEELQKGQRDKEELQAEMQPPKLMAQLRRSKRGQVPSRRYVSLDWTC